MRALWLASMVCVAQAPALFETHCARCHALDGKGGSVGPELSAIGAVRTPVSIRASLLDPNAEIYGDFVTGIVETRAGRVEGVVLNEDDLSVQLRLTSGEMRSFLKKDVLAVRHEDRSLMPSFRTKLNEGEIDGIVVYLSSLRGPAAAAVPRTREIARVTETLAWMTRPERDREEQPEAVLDALALRRTDVVADVGAGAGYFTWRIAKRVDRTIAVDIQRSMLQLNQEEAARRGARNIEFRESALEENSADVIFIANAYHEFAEPERMLSEFRRALRTGGRLVVLEYAKERPGVPVGEAHKMSLAEMRSEMEPAGFALERILDFLPIQNGLILRKR
ncbi:MAG: methyltransferase domain-containing protein [Acidobacteria bacterium]|nr:methyltransferase domain-containing protein [Acidobacteriota bacterium]